MTIPSSDECESVLDDLPFHLARAALVFRKFNDETLRTIGLHSQAPGMASVLHTLHEQDECTVSVLVSKTHLPNGTLTGLLDRLERDRLIQRVQNAEDGRSWRIKLTKKGRGLCGDLRRRHRLVMRLFRDVLTVRETAELKRMLARVTERMRDYHRNSGAKRPSARASARRQRTS